MSATRVLAVIVFAGALAAPSAAEVLTHTPSGLSFELPDDWSTTAEDDLLTATSAAGDVVISFFAARHDTVEAFIDGVTEELAGLVEDPQLTTDVTQEQINGLTQVYLEGTGQHDGAPIDWDLTLVVGGAHTLAVVALGDIETNQETLDAIYASIGR